MRVLSAHILRQLLLLSLVLALGASPVAAEPTAFERMQATQSDPFAIATFASQNNVSAMEAERRLRIQSLQGFLEPRLHARLFHRFGGVSWDPVTSQFVVHVTDNTAAGVAQELIDRNLVADMFRVEVVEFSLRELTIRQAQSAQHLSSLLSPSEFAIDIDISRNDLVATLDSEVSAKALSGVEDLLLSAPEPIRVRSRANIEVSKSLACTYPHCSTPLRGGVAISQLGAAFAGTPPGKCTSGFTAVLPSDYSAKYLVSAGHCMLDDGDPVTNEGRWKAYMRSYGDRQIGYVGEWFVDGRGDLSRIRVQDTSASPNWYTSQLIGRTQAWGNAVPERPLRGWVATPAIGSFYCRYGQRTSYSCGTVTTGSRCAPVSTENGVVTICNAWDGTAGAAAGDSGGPATGYGDIAFGVLSGGDSSMTRFTNIDALQANLGVWVIWEPT